MTAATVTRSERANRLLQLLLSEGRSVSTIRLMRRGLSDYRDLVRELTADGYQFRTDHVERGDGRRITFVRLIHEPLRIQPREADLQLFTPPSGNAITTN